MGEGNKVNKHLGGVGNRHLREEGVTRGEE